MKLPGLYVLASLVGLYCAPSYCNKQPRRVWVRQENGQTCSMTPPDLRQAFQTNCTQLVVSSSTCNQTWDAFSGAFAFKDPATVVNRYVGIHSRIFIRALIDQFMLHGLLGCHAARCLCISDTVPNSDFTEVRHASWIIQVGVFGWVSEGRLRLTWFFKTT